MKKILVTGGTGYIGSHTVVDLIENGYEVVVVDNLSMSREDVLDGIEHITGKRPTFYPIDLLDKKALSDVFLQEKTISGIIHFAAYKYVDESVSNPLKYYRNNIEGLINIIELAEEYNVSNFIFSSSCSIYGDIQELPVSENSTKMPTQSPYASTKWMGEKILEDVSINQKIRICALRYFNPVGAHTSGHIGESPLVIPNNLVPRITATAMGKMQKLSVFGHTFSTRDGSCIRDYIHVSDIAEAHTASLQYLENSNHSEYFEVFNLGSGEGVSVLELIEAFERVSGQKINFELADPRPGDVVAVYSDSSKANKILGWKPKRTIDDMMLSAWKWAMKQSQISIEE